MNGQGMHINAGPGFVRMVGYHRAVVRGQFGYGGYGARHREHAFQEFRTCARFVAGNRTRHGSGSQRVYLDWHPGWTQPV